MIKYLELALSQEVYEYLEELDEMNWSAWGNVLKVYLNWNDSNVKTHWTRFGDATRFFSSWKLLTSKGPTGHLPGEPDRPVHRTPGNNNGKSGYSAILLLSNEPVHSGGCITCYWHWTPKMSHSQHRSKIKQPITSMHRSMMTTVNSLKALNSGESDQCGCRMPLMERGLPTN
jgi:hypothetical protein